MKTRLWWMMPALLAVTAYAVETKVWTTSEAAEFEKGTLKALALSSDGRLSLAPVWKELHDAAIPHLWCAAADAKGTVYAAGAEGKVFALDPKGKPRTLATLEGGAVYAMTVSRAGDLFAAVSPGAKIYRIDASGKPLLYATLKANYIWALTWGTDGLLYAATGDPGQIHKINAAGQSTLFFDSEETHVRALIADGKGNLIAGTEPSGTVLRVSNTGAGFVLYQTAKREVTSLAVSPDGTVYAAASGTRGTAASAISTAPPVPIPPPPAQAAAQATASQTAARPAAAAPPPTLGAAPGGGSEIYRIAPDGEPRRIWSSAQLTVYALSLDKDGKLLAGTGNQGRIYRIDSEFVSTRLADSEPQQITALAPLPAGGLIAVTANPAKVFQLGPAIEKSGTLESELFDATVFTYWGRLRHEADLNGGAIRLDARSGNLDQARKNWSPWTPVDPKGERITAPPARFLGWRATLTAAPDGRSPVLKLVEAAYQAKNVAPILERIEITPANYKFPAPGLSLTASSSISLPPMGQPKRANPAAGSASDTGAATLTFEKGSLGARWKASDANGDSLEYKVELRGSEEREWKLLKDKLKEARLSWDSAALADGRYRLRVSATDELDNYPGQALSAQTESEEFVIDNTPPHIDALAARLEGSRLIVKFTAEDALSPLQYAEFSVNGGRWIPAPPSTRITDSLRHEYSAETDKPVGNEFTVAVKVADENDNMTVKKVTVR